MPAADTYTHLENISITEMYRNSEEANAREEAKGNPHFLKPFFAI
jgi:hypothetical protein